MKTIKKLLVAYEQINKKIPDPRNAEKYEISKTVRKQLLIPKTFENPNIVDIKSVITEHPKTSQKLKDYKISWKSRS